MEAQQANAKRRAELAYLQPRITSGTSTREGNKPKARGQNVAKKSVVSTRKGKRSLIRRPSRVKLPPFIYVATRDPNIFFRWVR